MASNASPPKPWERAQASGTVPSSSALATTNPSSSTPVGAAPSATSSSSSPAIPQRPQSLNSVVNRTASSYSNPTASSLNRPYGSSPYGYGSSYSSPYGMSSPYSRFGGGMYGSSYGYGSGMGGMYSGMGGMYGGGGMYGNGMFGGPGMNGNPNDPNNQSLTNNFAQSTQATFQIIESIVGAFGGFAQMLESTYMATHSSFFAMVSVAEQFGNLRQTLGSILGIYAIARWARTLIAKLTGRPPPADATSLNPAAFAAFASGGSDKGVIMGPDGRPVPKPSKKPFIVFLLAVFGLPYLMGKLIKTLAKNQQEQMENQPPPLLGPDGQPLPPHMQPQNQQASKALDPSKLDFCRVLYDFPPAEAASNGTFNSEFDLSVKKGDLVAVLDKSDPDGNAQAGDAAWWRCRARDGRMGYLPAVYLETIQRRPLPAQITSGADGASSRANSMPTAATAAAAKGAKPDAGSLPDTRAQTLSDGSALWSRSNTLKGPTSANVEKFQKAWVNDR